MPLEANAMKAKFKDRIYQGLKREFQSEISKGKDFQPDAEKMLLKIASAVSDIAMDIVQELQTNAQVAPGQAVVTSMGPGSTVSPGKIL
jgi:hypothetical protein